MDLPCSIPFYRWLLSEEHSLGLADLSKVAPEVQATLIRLHELVKKRDGILADMAIDALEKNLLVCAEGREILCFLFFINFYSSFQIESLDLDGCPIADLGFDFVLPGHANIELRRNGRDIPVTIHNLHQYISLVTHWFLVEGVQKQYEAFREGKCHSRNQKSAVILIISLQASIRYSRRHGFAFSIPKNWSTSFAAAVRTISNVGTFACCLTVVVPITVSHRTAKPSIICSTS